jgi:hypothetical protein
MEFWAGYKFQGAIMDRLSHYGIVVARVLISVVFVLNGFGIVDQTIPAKELMERGAPSAWFHR